MNMDQRRAEINRRSLLCAIPGIIGAGTATAALTVTKDQHHIWLNEWRAMRDLYAESLDDYGDETDASNAAWDRRMELERLITGTPATTDEGRAAQLDWLLEDSEGSFFDIGHGAVVQTLRKSYGLGGAV